MGGNIDQWFADLLYRLEGGHWLLKEAWVTSQLIHRGGKWLSVLASLGLIGLLLCACFNARGHRYRRPLLYLLLAVALSTGLVSLLKSVTQMDCPWDLSRYGGLRSFVGLFETRPADMPAAACFPGGHASAGYAWVALYFFALAVRPAWRWRMLTLALLTGATFGFGQQLRGAHFLSHDLWSLGISWLVAVSLYLWMLRPERMHAAQAVSVPPSISTSGNLA
ncbi:phosphatase PAP2 family protein [Stenotrophomonas sp. YIM B06876]|uniref:phosphatase PAP2 family protein n=1 Tax=Stenotrophomonas sp. YIM B06876 TaxID=3060211 RepID=UPI002738AF41|nr:phosphatase PAP2 family protein [Stenotrophomonas sp. YIM B06876]